MRAGVVSDIHGHYECLARAVQAMGRIDLLIHAGDGCGDIIQWQALNPFVPVKMVPGNCDLFAEYPEEAVFALDRWRVLLTHGHRYGVKSGLRRLLERAQHLGVRLVIYGHTHRPDRSSYGDIMLLNPGCLCPPRSHGRLSYGLIETSAEKPSITVEYL